jgi:hypothetical protein
MQDGGGMNCTAGAMTCFPTTFPHPQPHGLSHMQPWQLNTGIMKKKCSLLNQRQY